MGKIICMSDIHGDLDAFEKRICQLGNLHSVLKEDAEDYLVLLGDYVDEGPGSFQVLERIWNLQKKNPEHVIALKGNHEQWLLNTIAGSKRIVGMDTLRTFLDEKQKRILKFMLMG